ncbi:hypothetical protein LSH36_442g03132 [Paralvinella palmiformis]|uniref:Ribosome biogenesis protein BOP1 homolog n=1 Tax=Paralvinella palmiformis TaxID=53620 RepID=A0AAD9MZQ2_9ANNE|nr:hypothetical protein LSH36_442g03132 [Paralvinella palmiformis]
MWSKGKGKKRSLTQINDNSDEVDLFSKLTTKDKDDSDMEGGSSSDSTDSEESEYSGLEDEEDDSSEPESFEEMCDSGEEEGSDVVGTSDNDNEKMRNDVQKFKKNLANEKAKHDGENSVQMKVKKKAGSIKRKSGETVNGKEEAASTSTEVTVNVPDEYEYDSSDEEDLRNTVGNIPMEWYREYEHIGYNLEGKKIIKPPTGDELDNFLNKMDNPDYWRTVVDKTTGQKVVLSEKDCEIIKRFRQGKYIDSKFDPYEPWIDFFTYEKMQHPVTNRPADKRSFVPSKWERIKVSRMVHAIKMGWMKPQQEKRKEEDQPKFYMLWNNDEQVNIGLTISDITRKYRSHIPAPKLQLPGHEESYNPPPEYLLTEEEELAWKNKDPEDRRLNFLPKTYSSLRQVPGYNELIKERFERCLDLYLCPRKQKLRMNVDPEDLLPKLPKPKDLQPFPTTQSIVSTFIEQLSHSYGLKVYKGHDNIVRCISVESNGQWIVSGSDDQTLKFWEVATGRCMKTLPVGGVVKSVAWNPNSMLCLVAATVGNDVIIINPGLGDKLVLSNTDNLIESYVPTEAKDTAKVQWEKYSGEEEEKGFRLKITHFKAVGHVTWHGRGDYMAVVVPGGESKSVVIHQLSRRRSQNPFSKSKGLVQCVLFHPSRPFFFVATQRYVRVYNLLKQELTKKLLTNVKWVSSMAVHPGGDNLIIGSYDCRLSWFDLDLSTKPYQTLRHHKKAIRQVCYHKKYPLFASSSDDGTVIICHGRVYNDLLQNPLIVPVKVLRGHTIENSIGVLASEFHPTQPWIFSSGADHTIRLFT